MARNTRRTALARLLSALARDVLHAAVRVVRDELREWSERGELSVQVAVVEAVDTIDGVSWADVSVQPSGVELTCRVVAPIPGLTRRARVDDEVLVLVPRGKWFAGPLLLGRLATDEAPEPEAAALDHTVLEADHELHASAAEAVRVSAPAIVLSSDGQAGVAAARVGDPIALQSGWVTWLQGVAGAAGYGVAMPPQPVGAISAGSAVVKLG